MMKADVDTASHGSAFDFLPLASGYWRQASIHVPWRLGAAIASLILLNLMVNFGLNRWHRWFFDALERKQHGMVIPAVGMLAALILLGATFAVAMIRCRMSLQIGWRQWLTEKLLGHMAARAETGAGPVPRENHGSPAYRIAEDVRLAIDPIVDLAVGFVNAVVLGVTFVGILIVVGGSLPVTVGGMEFTIPAYLAVAAAIYAAVVSSTMYLIGRPLIRRIGEKNEAEAQFLFELNHTAEQADAYSSMRPVRATLKALIRSWRLVVREYCRLTWLSNSSAYFAPALPLLLTAPKYIEGDLTLGAVMQLAAAFTIVLGALNWFTDNYVRIAEWSASARRVDELWKACS